MTGVGSDDKETGEAARSDRHENTKVSDKEGHD